ncbi:MAG: prepilin-type N-terminal cleavage/methylation domain-containing protein [Pseudomonadales bacterium]
MRRSKNREVCPRVTASVCRGFTLLEILIALAVLALLGAAIVKQTNSSAKIYYSLGIKVQASEIAENALEETLTRDFLPTGTITENKTINSVEWRIDTVVESSLRDDMRKLTINVFHSEGDGAEANTVASLQSYIGRH